MLEIGVASGVRLTRATLYELGRPLRRARHFAIVGQAVARNVHQPLPEPCAASPVGPTAPWHAVTAR